MSFVRVEQPVLPLIFLNDKITPKKKAPPNSRISKILGAVH
jgi:hypothetical protein